MKTTLLSILTSFILAGAALPSVVAETNKWSVDVSLYGLAAAMSGDVTVKGVQSELDLGFDDILEDLELGGMGKIRVGYGRFGFTTDVIYMGLGGSKNGVSVDVDQWMVEPSLSFKLCECFEVLAGARYNNISAELRGPRGRYPSGTQDWWDPIVGANVRLPLGEKFSLHLRGDAGGFDVGSDLTWQAFPYVGWRLTKDASVQAGYRWVYNDYESGSGRSQFGYDVLTQGPQIGFTWSF